MAVFFQCLLHELKKINAFYQHLGWGVQGFGGDIFGRSTLSLLDVHADDDIMSMSRQSMAGEILCQSWLFKALLFNIVENGHGHFQYPMYPHSCSCPCAGEIW